MKPLNYSKNSWHAWLWYSTYGEGEWRQRKLPSNICTYFWTLVLAIITIPINIPGHILNIVRSKKRYYKVPAFLMIIHIPCLIICGAFYTEAQAISFTSSYPLDRLLQMYLYGYPGIVLFAFYLLVVGGALVLIVVGLGRIAELFKRKRKTYKQPKPNPLIEGWKAFKGKYCSKIEWN